MKINQALLVSRIVVLSLCIAVATGVGWQGGTLAHAADSTWHITLVPIEGMVEGKPETVVFQGEARVSSRLAQDSVFNKPSLMLAIDLSGVSAIGTLTKSNYIISGQERIQRNVDASQLIEITFPFGQGNMTRASEVQTGVASFALNVDISNGMITTGKGNVSSPNYLK